MDDEIDIEELREHYALMLPGDPERQARWLEWARVLLQCQIREGTGRGTGRLH
jgi:hypothetical protein